MNAFTETFLPTEPNPVDCLAARLAESLCSTMNRLACSGLFPRWEAWIRPSTETDPGVICCCPVDDRPEGFAEPLRVGMLHDASACSRETLTARFRDALRRAPLYPYGN